MTSVAAVSVQPAQPAAPQILPRGHEVKPYAQASTRHVVLEIESIGYLVPGTDFAGRVHSVFAQACNLAVQRHAADALRRPAPATGRRRCALHARRRRPARLVRRRRTRRLSPGSRANPPRRASVAERARLASCRARRVAVVRAHRGSSAPAHAAPCAAPRRARERDRRQGCPGGGRASGCVPRSRLRASGATRRSPDRLGRRPDAGRRRLPGRLARRARCTGATATSGAAACAARLPRRSRRAHAAHDADRGALPAPCRRRPLQRAARRPAQRVARRRRLATSSTRRCSARSPSAPARAPTR